jgi:hypothetical protein
MSVYIRKGQGIGRGQSGRGINRGERRNERGGERAGRGKRGRELETIYAVSE